MMVLEVAAGDQGKPMQAALAQVSAAIGVDIDMHALDDAVL